MNVLTLQEWQALTERSSADAELILDPLLRSSSVAARRSAVRAGAALFDDETLTRWLSDGEDATRRNAALEMIRKRGRRGRSLVRNLLSSPDSDVVLQAAQVLQEIAEWDDLTAIQHLLESDDTNIVQTALLALGHRGGPNAVPVIRPYLCAGPWLQLAAIEALRATGSHAAISDLASLLADGFVAEAAAEAIASIGGPEALGTLAFAIAGSARPSEADPSIEMERSLVHVLERAGTIDARLRRILMTHFTRRFEAGPTECRLFAARALLSLGPGPMDEQALAIAADHLDSESGESIPDCLLSRADLVRPLLARGAAGRQWGLRLALRNCSALQSDLFADVVRLCAGDAEELPRLAESLLSLPSLDSKIAEAVVQVFVESPPELRQWFVPAIRRHALSFAVHSALPCVADDPVSTAVLRVFRLGGGEALGALNPLSPEDRRAALLLLGYGGEPIGDLPWADWLKEDAVEYARVICSLAPEAAQSSAPDLQASLEKFPTPEVIAAVVHLRYRPAVSIMLSWLPRVEDAALIVSIIDALGFLTCSPAHEALRRLASDNGPFQSAVYRALARYADPADAPVFSNASRHPDWTVRHCCLDYFAVTGDRRALLVLSTDPVEHIAERALTRLQEAVSS